MGNTHLIEWLGAFNRKERYYLVAQALGGFTLSPQFRALLGETIGQEIPAKSAAWMDYHLDWVFAALTLRDISPNDVDGRVFESPDFRGPDPLPGTQPVHVNTNQEDIDLLVAFRDRDLLHLIFLEAKGETSWGNRQLRSKIRRLGAIFPQVPAGLSLSFVLASPRRPQRLDVPEGCPRWVAPYSAWRWMPLDVPPGRREIERWDAHVGAAREQATTWRVRPTPGLIGDARG